MNGALSTRERPHESWAGLAVALAVTTYARAPWTFFSGDDIVHLSRAAGFVPWNGVYRPLSEGAAFWLQYRLFGLNAFGFHVVTLALHAFNVVAVYLLAERWLESRATACAAAVLFGCASIAFTPLHWASGVIELLACGLLLASTLLHLETERGGSFLPWWAAGLALSAMLAKETAAAWPALILWIEWRRRGLRSALKATIPAATATVAFLVALTLSGHFSELGRSAAYAVSISPRVWLGNFLTYVGWCVSLWDPIRDRVATSQPAVWPVAAITLLVLAAVLRALPRPSRGVAATGLIWYVVFLAPVLPLVSHTYLYYLYVPWVGGALALAAAARGMLESRPFRHAGSVAVVTLGLFTLVEVRNVRMRERATSDALPVDRTMREASLLSNTIPALLNARLSPGTPVGFVNPVPGRSFDLLTGAPTDSSDRDRRVSYWPLEAAMHDGATLRLFVPEVVYRGFVTRIPADWMDVQCFRFEQRGWLQPWGKGQQALMHQAELLMEARNWSAADSTWLRVRAIADTIPAALSGQLLARSELGHRDSSDSLAHLPGNRWPGSPAAVQTRSARP